MLSAGPSPWQDSRLFPRAGSRQPHPGTIYDAPLPGRVAKCVGITAILGLMGEFKVSVYKDYLGFAAAHFITFTGHQCESLHGHNYRVGVTVSGSVDSECAFVVDFAILKGIVRELVDAMDHKVLLPMENPKLSYAEEGESLRVDYFGKRRFLFPRADCALVPISNTTAEMIGEYLALQLRDHLVERGIANLTGMELEVEESIGQSAFYSLRFD